jgi:DNA end-binding protein Ku
MRGTQYVGALRAHGAHLVLIALRHREERLELPTLSSTKTRQTHAPDAKELALAKQLVATLEGELDMGELRSEYHERVIELLDKKVRGESVKLEHVKKKPATVTSLEKVLKASLTKAKGHPQSARSQSGHPKERHATKQKKSA